MKIKNRNWKGRLINPPWFWYPCYPTHDKILHADLHNKGPHVTPHDKILHADLHNKGPTISAPDITDHGFRSIPTYPNGRGRVEKKRILFFSDSQNSDHILTYYSDHILTIFSDHIWLVGIGRKRLGSLMGSGDQNSPHSST